MTENFSESDYLAAYPDVARAVASGQFKSGLHHYEAYGRKEGRLPRAYHRQLTDTELRQAVGSFIEGGYLSINGMSSQLAARCMAEILVTQHESGLGGPVLELGVFEGRAFVLMSLASPNDTIVGVDTFVFPDEGQLDRFRGNLDRFGVNRQRVREIKASTLDVSAAPLLSTLGGKARFIHVDADHSYKSVTHDIALAHQCLASEGVLCMDDLLHPVYPGLTIAVHDYLRKNPDLRIFAIIDRELVTSSTKYLVCRAPYVPFYQQALRTAMPRKIRKVVSDEAGHHAIIIVPDDQPA